MATVRAETRPSLVATPPRIRLKGGLIGDLLALVQVREADCHSAPSRRRQEGVGVRAPRTGRNHQGLLGFRRATRLGGERPRGQRRGRQRGRSCLYEYASASGHVGDDFHTRPHRAAHIVLMGNRVTEHSQDAIAGGSADVSLVAGDDSPHLFAIPSHDRAVSFRLNSRRQLGGIDQVGEEDRQPSVLTGIARSGQQILGICVASVDSEHLPCQGRRGHTITPIDRLHGSVNQRIDRGTSLGSSVAASRRAGAPAHHPSILSVRISGRRGFGVIGICWLRSSHSGCPTPAAPGRATAGALPRSLRPGSVTSRRNR
jgi:hypothetical protein